MSPPGFFQVARKVEGEIQLSYALLLSMQAGWMAGCSTREKMGVGMNSDRARVERTDRLTSHGSAHVLTVVYPWHVIQACHFLYCTKKTHGQHGCMR